MRILIVDDEADHRFLLRKGLAGYYETLDECDNGEDAVEAFAKALADDRPYDMITLDINMPKMDGHEVRKKIREIEKERNISGENRAKILMVSAERDAGTIQKSLDEESEIYIVKPINRDKIDIVMKELGFV